MTKSLNLISSRCLWVWWVGLTSCRRLCQLLLMEICQLKCFHNTESTVNMLTFCLDCWLRTLNEKGERQTWDTSLFPQSGQLTGWRRGGKAFCGVDKCSRSWCCSPLGLWASALAATCPWACCPACPRPGGAGRAGGSGWAGKPGGERRTDSGAASPPGYSRVVTGDIISPKIQELVVARNHRFWGLRLISWLQKLRPPNISLLVTGTIILPYPQAHSTSPDLPKKYQVYKVGLQNWFCKSVGRHSSSSSWLHPESFVDIWWCNQQSQPAFYVW